MTKELVHKNVGFYLLLIGLLLMIYSNQTIWNYELCTIAIMCYLFFSLYDRKETILKNIFNPFFMFTILLWMYGSTCIFQFILDNGIPRIRYFVIDKYNMLLYAKAIFGIVTIYSGIVLLIQKKDFNFVVKKNINISNKLNLVDVIVFPIAFYYLILAVSKDFYNMDISLENHMMYDTATSKYLSLVMWVYFVLNHESIFFFNKDKKSSYRDIYINLLFFAFWGSIIFIGRRMFLNCLISLIILKFFKEDEKVSFINKIIFTIVVVFLAIIGLFRNNIGTDRNFADYLYYLLGEFILVGYVTIPFLTWKGQYLHGVTYLKNVFYSFLPRAFFPDKPLSLGTQFKKMYSLNVSFAFNPIAEAFWNFSWLAIVIVPIIMILYVFCVKKLAQKDALFSVIFYGSIVDFCRGTMATSVFQIVFLYLVYRIMIYLCKIKIK